MKIKTFQERKKKEREKEQKTIANTNLTIKRIKEIETLKEN